MEQRRFRVTVIRPAGGPTEVVDISAADEAGVRSIADRLGYTVVAVVELGVLRSEEPDATLNSLREEVRGVRKDLREVESSITRHAFFGALLALIVFTVGGCFVASLMNGLNG
jgi:hypothetical protein